MDKNLKYTLIFSAVIGLATFFGLIYSPGSFLIQPKFELDVEPKESTMFIPIDINGTKISTNSYVISIENVGLIQAKDVRVYVSSTGGIQQLAFQCPELQQDQSSRFIQKTETISVERMSVNLVCNIQLDTSLSSELDKVIVTATDSPSASWNFEEEETDQIESLFTEISRIIFIVVSIIVVVISLVRLFKEYQKTLYNTFYLIRDLFPF